MKSNINYIRCIIMI